MAQSHTARGDRAKQRIIEGAAAVVLEFGVTAVTLEEIRSRTSTSNSQLFHYFPGGKAEILAAVAEHEANRSLTEPQMRIPELDTWAGWEQWRDQLVGEYDRHGESCPLTTIMAQFMLTIPGAEKVTRTLTDQWHEHIQSGIEIMQARKILSPGLNASQTTRAIVAGIHGGALMAMSTGTNEHISAAIDFAIDHLKHYEVTAPS